MNFVNSRCFLVLFVYFSAAVLVIVDGQSTTDDDDTDKYDIIKFIDRIAKLEHNLAAAVHTVAELKIGCNNYETCRGASKFCIFMSLCHVLVYSLSGITEPPDNPRNNRQRALTITLIPETGDFSQGIVIV